MVEWAIMDLQQSVLAGRSPGRKEHRAVLRVVSVGEGYF